MMIVKFTPDDGRRVYAMPVALRVECTLYILARTDEAARSYAMHADLEDYFSFDTDSLSTDGERLLKINDVIADNIVDLSALMEMPTSDYPPNEHPDFVGEPHK